jgi:uncharacterized protein (TIGR03067 family)
MRRIALAFAVVGVLTGGGSPRADDVDARSSKIEAELARLRGTWQLVSAETDGEKAPEERVEKIRVIIENSHHTVKFGDVEIAHEVPFTIDPTTEPGTTIDTIPDGPDRGKTIRGIYKLEGDTLTSCVARVGEPAPTEFAAGAGSGHTLRVFRKVKPMTDRDKAIADELAKFEGTWRYESMTVEGRTFPAELGKSSRLVLKGDSFTMTDPTATYRGTFAVDPTVTPRTIDVTFTEGPEAGKVSRGIYELDGDTYKVCMGLAGRDRPIEFESKPGSGCALQVLKREK